MKKVMVVDDEFIVRVGIKSVINWEEEGYIFAGEAKNGAEALEKIEIDEPDIVLTDLVMDTMDGFELIRVCGKRFPRIRFVVLSSYNDFENVKKAMKLGARDYIYKLKTTQAEILRVLNEIDFPEPEKQERIIQENKEAIKSAIIAKGLAGGFTGAELEEQCRSLSLKMDFSIPWLILYTSIDDFSRIAASGIASGGHKDIQLVKSTMGSIFHEAFDGFAPLEVFNMEKGDMAFFVNVPAQGAEDENRMRDCFLKSAENIKRYLALEISGTISPVSRGADHFFDVLGTCADTMNKRGRPAALWPYNNGGQNEILLAKEYIVSHIAENLDVREIASHVGMSESYFSHLFKQETGEGVIDCINRLRMEKAAALLDDLNLKVAAVAEQVGMKNHNYFSTLFKKVIGFTPSEYREKIKEF